MPPEYLSQDKTERLKCAALVAESMPFCGISRGQEQRANGFNINSQVKNPGFEKILSFKFEMNYL